MDADTYPAVFTIKPGKYAGQVRNIYRGAILTCGHSHKSRTAALECAKNLDKVRR